MVKQTLAKEYQTLLFSLFQKNLFNLDGITKTNPNGMQEEYIPKSIMVESAILILNELGELIDSDGRFKHEIDTDEAQTLLEETEADKQLSIEGENE